MYRSHTSDESDGYKFQLFFRIWIQYIRDHDRADLKKNHIFHKASELLHQRFWILNTVTQAVSKSVLISFHKY